MVRGVDELGKDGRIIGWRVYLVPWMFTKRPLAVKNPLMMIYFWEFHWSSWRLVEDRQKRKRKSSEFEYWSIANCRHRVIPFILSCPILELISYHHHITASTVHIMGYLGTHVH
jgi:hypothetical protein